GSGRVRLPAGPVALRRDRSERGSRLRVAALGPGGEPDRRRAVARPPAAAARFPARGRAARGAAEHRGGRRSIPPDRLFSAARSLRDARRAAAGLPPRLPGGRGEGRRRLRPRGRSSDVRAQLVAASVERRERLNWGQARRYEPALITPIARTRMRLSAQTMSRLNQLLAMNFNPSHSCTA